MKISVLSGNEIERIKIETERLIEEVGFKVHEEKIRQEAKKAGAIVDEGEQTVKIPKELLRKLLSTVPSSYTIKTIDGTEYEIGKGKQHVVGIVTDPWIVDYKTQSPRRPSMDDIKTNTILGQKNPDVAIISRMDFPVTDYDDATSSHRALELNLLNHAKHYAVYCASLESFNQWMEIGRRIAPGGELAGSKLMTVAVAVVSPLCLTDFNAEILLGAAENGFVVIPTICPMAGTTSPYNMSATLLQGNVENLFIAALTQILNPGNPFLYAFGPSVSDMRNGQSHYYSLDKALWKVATAELAKSYNMPAAGECGGMLSHRYDMQGGAESMMFMTLAQNSGFDFLCGLGSCMNANGLSSEWIVIQYAWLAASRFLSKGISFEYFDKGAESIEKQKYGGHFLMDDLTIELLRSDEFFSSDIYDLTGGYEADAPTMLENAHRKIGEITADFVSPVPENVQEEIRRYFHDLYNKIK